MLLINNENLFLIALGLIWIIGAVIQDIKRREVDNLWNFSLIGFALAYRLIVSVFNGDYWFFINGLLGLAIFLFLGNLFYYSRIFAGGDAKLLIALGAILPLDYNWISNFKIFGSFVLLFLVCGSIYVLIWSFVLIFRNWDKFKKEFVRQWKTYQKIFFIFLIFIIIFIVILFALSNIFLALIGLVVLLFPILFVFARAVEESCMKKFVKPRNLTEGEWLYEDIVVAGKKIKANWEGVSKEELRLIKNKYKKSVLIKQGVPFTPSFLFAFVLLLFLFWRYRMFW